MDVTMAENNNQINGNRSLRKSVREITDYTIVRTAEAAAMLSITKKHLNELSKNADFPKKVRLGTKAVGWRVKDLEIWIDSKQSMFDPIEEIQNED